jgi:hypothetical protein
MYRSPGANVRSLADRLSAGEVLNDGFGAIVLKKSLSAMFDFLGGLRARHSKISWGGPANSLIAQRARSSAGLRWC